MGFRGGFRVGIGIGLTDPEIKPSSSFGGPDDIDDLTAWWDPDDSDTITLSGSDVTTMACKVDPGDQDFVSVTGRTLPVISTFMGRDWLSFDSARTDAMRVVSTSSAGINFGSGELTLCVLFTAADSTNGTLLNKGGSVAGRYRFTINQTTAGSYRILLNDGTTSLNPLAGDTAEDGNPHLVTAILDRGTDTLSLRADGVEIASVDASALGNIDESPGGGFIANLLLGASPSGATTNLHHYGRIGEITFYNRALTSGELANLENYLMNKWGVAA